MSAILSPQQLRGSRLGVVLVAGLTEGVFPARPRLDPVLGDDDRTVVRQRLGLRLELSTERPAEAALLFALAAASARERLVLLHPRSDAATGAPRLPSRLLLQAQAVFQGTAPLAADADRPEAARGLVVVEDGEGRRHGAAAPGPGGESPAAALSAADYDWAAATALASCDRREARAYVGALLGPQAARRRAVLRNRHVTRFTRWDGLLPPAAARSLARDLLGGPLSASAVEAYLRCPFAYFVRYGLAVEPLEEPEDVFELQPSDLGQLVHEVLRRLYAGLMAGDLPAPAAGPKIPSDAPDEAFEGALAAALDEALDGAVDEARREGLIGFAPAWAPRLAALRRDLLQVLRADPSWTDGSRPVHLEWEFGGDGPVFDVDGRRLSFRGRIDRVDRTVDGSHVRVIDYKTGRGTGERRRLEHDTDVQLPVYRLVAEALVPPPARVECVFRMVTRAGGLTDLALPTDAASVHEALRSVLRTFAEGVESGVFPRWRTKRGACGSCSYAYGCGMDAAAAERKRADPRLAALLAFKEADA